MHQMIQSLVRVFPVMAKFQLVSLAWQLIVFDSYPGVFTNCKGKCELMAFWLWLSFKRTKSYKIPALLLPQGSKIFDSLTSKKSKIIQVYRVFAPCYWLKDWIECPFPWQVLPSPRTLCPKAKNNLVTFWFHCSNLQGYVAKLIDDIEAAELLVEYVLRT